MAVRRSAGKLKYGTAVLAALGVFTSLFLGVSASHTLPHQNHAEGVQDTAKAYDRSKVHYIPKSVVGNLEADRESKDVVSISDVEVPLFSFGDEPDVEGGHLQLSEATSEANNETEISLSEADSDGGYLAPIRITPSPDSEVNSGSRERIEGESNAQSDFKRDGSISRKESVSSHDSKRVSFEGAVVLQMEPKSFSSDSLQADHAREVARSAKNVKRREVPLSRGRRITPAPSTSSIVKTIAAPFAQLTLLFVILTIGFAISGNALPTTISLTLTVFCAFIAIATMYFAATKDVVAFS